MPKNFTRRFVLPLAGCILALILLNQCSGSSGGGSDPTAQEATPGNTFYVDPLNGSISNDGSADFPWRTLQEVIEQNLIETTEYETLPYEEGAPMVVKNAGAPVKPGDTLVLRDGYHGELRIIGAYNTAYVTIKAQAGHRPVLSRIHLTAVSKWRLQDLTVSPEAAPQYENDTLVFVESHNWRGPSFDVVIDGCTLYSVAASAGWTDVDWNAMACNCIQVSGDDMTISNNHCKNVNFGITVSGDNSLIHNNIVENFAGDGMRGLGNDLVFEYNLVKNCYAVNSNHDDGFQSWSINDDPPRERVILRGNVFINYEDPNQPYRGTLQGIGCFDGPYVDWIVENNVVIVDHWHGIAFYGAYGCLIVNNTVVDQNDISPGPPWSRVDPHKDGTASRGCVIRNNIAPQIITSEGVTADHNYLVTDYNATFQDCASFDLRPRADAAVIDAGSPSQAPAEDADGTPRPRGRGYDIGAYEY